MPPFTKEDFLKPEVGQKLSVIIMSRMDKYVLTPFSRLLQKERRKFNELLNEYISSLGENWEDTLVKDFNETCHLEIFDTENFLKVDKLQVPMGESELILTDEQKQFQEDMKDPVKYQEWLDKLNQDIIEQERLAEERGRVHIIQPQEPASEELKIEI